MSKKVRNFFSLYGFFLQRLYEFLRKSSGNTGMNDRRIKLTSQDGEIFNVCHIAYLMIEVGMLFHYFLFSFGGNFILCQIFRDFFMKSFQDGNGYSLFLPLVFQVLKD